MSEMREVTAAAAIAFDDAIVAVKLELERAMTLHNPMAGRHEGYAVILEELDELWDECKVREPNLDQLRTEALHVAAMALRFVVDIT